MKFITVTDHYGFCFERCGGENLYVIYRIENGKPDRVITARKKRKDAVSECKYLERLNEPKFKRRKEEK